MRQEKLLAVVGLLSFIAPVWAQYPYNFYPQQMMPAPMVWQPAPLPAVIESPQATTRRFWPARLSRTVTQGPSLPATETIPPPAVESVEAEALATGNLILPAPTPAENVHVADGPHSSSEYLAPGACDLQLLGGAYYSPPGESGKYSFAMAAIRLGIVCEGTYFDGTCIRGHIEPMLEINGAKVFDGDFGERFAGTSLQMRYNMVQPGCKLVPYVQAGIGAQFNDAHTDRTQTAVAQPVEMVASGHLGMRYFVKRCLSLDAETGYMRITAVGNAPRNDGINAMGASLGLTIQFP